MPFHTIGELLSTLGFNRIGRLPWVCCAVNGPLNDEPHANAFDAMRAAGTARLELLPQSPIAASSQRVKRFSRLTTFARIQVEMSKLSNAMIR
jgi:hypothetical protein